MFFFIVPPTTEIYTLSLHDALPISAKPFEDLLGIVFGGQLVSQLEQHVEPRDISALQFQILLSQQLCLVLDRKSTRLNSSHVEISYAVFCLKKKKKIT